MLIKKNLIWRRKEKGKENSIKFDISNIRILIKIIINIINVNGFKFILEKKYWKRRKVSQLHVK